MKVVFAGPSIYGLSLCLDDIVLRPPAEMGDIERAVAEGCTVIGIIDGHYEQVASVWHKEILFALSRRVTVVGAASMGALRAAECAAFGMIPIGEIARRYCTGELCDDAAVAILNGPAELGWPPVTEPLVNALATVDHLRDRHSVTAREALALSDSAKRLFFQDRTAEAMIAGAGLVDRAPHLLQLYREHYINLKVRDAGSLVEAVRGQADELRRENRQWIMARSPFWDHRGVHAAITER